MLAHLFVFLGLYQIGYTPEQWKEVRQRAAHPGDLGVLATLQTLGPIGLLRAYYRTGDDERLYHEYARLTLTGKADLAFIAQKHRSAPIVLHTARPWPYRDVLIEYPPLALVLGVLPPALFGSSYIAYRFGLGAWLLVLHLLSVWLASQVLAGGPENTARSQQALVTLLRWSLAFCICLGGIVVTRLDDVATVTIMAAAFFLTRSLASVGRASARSAVLMGLATGIGAMTKIVPVLAMPVVAIAYLLSRRPDRFRLIALSAFSMALVLGVIHGAAWLSFGDGYLAAYRYHALRGLQLETSYSGWLMLAHAVGMPLRQAFSYGSANLISPVADACASISPLLFAGLAAILFGHVLWRGRCEPIALLGALLTLFVLTNKVLSPQYLLWLWPLVFIVMLRERDARFGWVLVGAAVLSQVMYPRAYDLLAKFNLVMVLVLNLRNALLFALLALFWRAVYAPAGRR